MISARRLALLAGVAIAAAFAAPSSAGAPATFGSGVPSFVTSAAPDSLVEAGNAGEPSLGISWKSGNAFYMSGSSTYKLHVDDRATPPAISWYDVSSPYSLFNVDPILATDPATGITFAGGDNTACAVMSRTSDDGESWASALPCTGVVDHPAVGVGPFAGPPPLGASGPVAAYFCQQYPLADQCSRSIDGGATWSPSVPVRGCLGLFGHLQVAPNGTAYVPGRECYSGGDLFSGTMGIGGFRSPDNGLTWSSYTIPGAKYASRGFDPSVAIGTDGGVWETWSRDGDAHPEVSMSGDSALHWTEPVDLAGTVDPPITGSSFPTMVAGGPGRAAVAYLGTRHQPATGTSPYDDKLAVWQLYVSTTYDGGQTWTTVQATADPVQLGPISDGGVAATDTRNLLDFIGAGVTRDGRVMVGFADGCTERRHCTEPDAKATTSTDAYATVAYQATGRGLFEEFDR